MSSPTNSVRMQPRPPSDGPSTLCHALQRLELALSASRSQPRAGRPPPRVGLMEWRALKSRGASSAKMFSIDRTSVRKSVRGIKRPAIRMALTAVWECRISGFRKMSFPKRAPFGRSLLSYWSLSSEMQKWIFKRGGPGGGALLGGFRRQNWHPSDPSCFWPTLDHLGHCRLRLAFSAIFFLALCCHFSAPSWTFLACLITSFFDYFWEQMPGRV